ncbi:MAG: DegT/DnrJ/EryC1/StrS family aminotransferase [Acidimicrobiia bacterium]
MEFVDLAAQERRLGSRLRSAIDGVLAHRRFVNGPEVAELEQQLGRYCGVEHAVACSSGTDALVLSLMALRLAPGDRVIVPTFTFAATAEAVAFLGGVPVFVDVDAATFALSPASVARAFSQPGGAPIVGVVPVDLFGHPAPHGEIAELARAHGAWVLTDAAQSFGASWNGRRAGSIGRMATTSFFPAKPLGCYGDGGAVFTDDGELAAVVRSLRSHGAGADRYDNVRIGMTGRLDTIQAAILLEKLAIFDEELERRQEVASRYTELLDGAVETPSVSSGCRSAWSQYTCLVDNRDLVAKELASEHIPTAVYYPRPLHRQAAYEGYPVVEGGTPVADDLCSRVLSLPMHPYLEPADQERVAQTVRRAVGA